MTNNSFEISGNIVDIFKRRIFPGTIRVVNGKISDITEDKNTYDSHILPGFIDSHIHIESSMLVPSEFARLASVHGTVSTVSDPHEIANVLGTEGIKYMIENGSSVPFRFYFGAPSCVPATSFETSGAVIGADDIEMLFSEYSLKYLSEMMNYPGVLFGDKSVKEKLGIAKKYNKPVDGHAPGLRGADAKKYIDAGISTDHECFGIDEAREKISYGMKILIRDGSAAKNFDELHPLISEYPDMVMFCSDDKHPDDLVKGHINLVVKKALSLGYDFLDVLKIACINPVNHYRLETGILRQGDNADFIVVDDFSEFNILKTYVSGSLIAEKGKTLIPHKETPAINKFNASSKNPDDFTVQYKGGKIKVIEAIDGQLITNEIDAVPRVAYNKIISDTENDILKITVINRYDNLKPSVGFIKNFGLKKGAIASCVAHDSHNIIAVGADDESICIAVNEIIRHKGGISVVNGNEVNVLPLPVAGIMSNDDGYKVAEKYTEISKKPASLGCRLHSPFMTLSFMALLVIPSLKLGDKGLFDGSKFEFTTLETAE